MTEVITIPDSGTESNGVSIGSAPMTFIALETDTFTTSDITFQALGQDRSTWKTICDQDGLVYTIPSVESDRFYPLNPSVFIGVSTIGAVSSNTQGQLTTLYMIKEPV